jgi:hypothetical protein
MYDQALFHLVFLSQVLLLSFFLPRMLLRRAHHVLETYPPESYPKLYPVSFATVRRAMGAYSALNFVMLAVGLALVLIRFYAASEEMLNGDTSLVITAYFFLQFAPMVVPGVAGFTYVQLQRKADRRTTRKAELRPRRLFDFVSPAVVGLAVAVYLAFVLLVAYVRQFDFPWFGGYWNVIGITFVNLLFAGLIVHTLRGKRKDPYQTHEDRRRQMGITLRSLVWISILGTAFIALSIGLSAFELRHLNPIFTSLYLQLIAVISFRSFRIDDVDFEVYRDEPLTT